MRIGSISKVGAAVALHVTAGVALAGQHVTYVGDGSVTGLAGALPEAWLPADAADPVRFKGQLQLTRGGKLVGAMLEAGGVLLRVAPTDAPGLYGVRAAHETETVMLGLSAPTILSDRATLAATLTGNGASQAVEFDLSGMSERMLNRVGDMNDKFTTVTAAVRRRR